MRKEKEIKTMLRSKKYAYFDIQDNLGLSDDEYYEMIQKDVNEWRIRCKSLSATQEQRKRIIELHNTGMTTQEIAEELRTLASNVANLLKSQGMEPRVVRKAFSENTRSVELEKHICKLFDLGLPSTHICIETKYNFRTSKSITDILKKYNRNQKSNIQKELYVNSNIFNFIDSEEKAYWLGLLMTDGWIYKRGGTHTIGLCLEEEDKYLVEKFKKFVGTNNKISEKRTKNKTGEVKLHYTIMITSKTIFNDLKRYGVIEKKSNNTSPNLHLIPEELHNHFWRGCFDGDGSYYYNSGGKLTFTYTGTIDITYKFLAWLYYKAGSKEFKKAYPIDLECDRKNGIKATVQMYSFSLSLKEDIEKISEVIYKGSTIYMKRKYEMSRIINKPKEE